MSGQQLVVRPTGESSQTDRVFIVSASSLRGRPVELVLTPDEAYSMLRDLNVFLGRVRYAVGH